MVRFRHSIPLRGTWTPHIIQTAGKMTLIKQVPAEIMDRHVRMTFQARTGWATPIGTHINPPHAR